MGTGKGVLQVPKLHNELLPREWGENNASKWDYARQESANKLNGIDCRSDLKRAVLHNAMAPFSLTKHAKRSCLEYERNRLILGNLARIGIPI